MTDPRISEIDPLDAFRTPNAARFATATNIRYEDLDINGHVNHARYLAYIEECRLALRRHLNTSLKLSEDIGWVIGAITIRYHRSVLYPATVRVETRPIHIGRTSFTLGYGLYDGAHCAVTALSRSICLDRAQGNQPVPLPDALAQELRARMNADQYWVA
ncbi:MAG: acyl-CoA thioesterase [Acetobacteraceae bacterium]|nr:acyl-CoA thioesterase [Acetobacteraceae bacterium]MSP29709.1 acyl-CoA thioesterase [Acetobacteraceae bacterium]